jgi:hypothetical protein
MNFLKVYIVLCSRYFSRWFTWTVDFCLTLPNLNMRRIFVEYFNEL